MSLRSSTGSLLSWLLPVAACSTCPVCLSMYASVFSCLGSGFALTERTHGVLLAVALCVAVTMSIIAATRHRRLAPPVLTGLGALILLVSHFYFDRLMLEVVGTSTLIAGNFWGVRLRRHVHVGHQCGGSCGHAHAHGDASLSEGRPPVLTGLGAPPQDHAHLHNES